jgi:hypothetical protein
MRGGDGVKNGFNRAWFLHPQWEEANRACEHATGMGLYDAWDESCGCTNMNARGWMTYEQVAEAIAALVFGYEAWEVTA